MMDEKKIVRKASRVDTPLPTAPPYSTYSKSVHTPSIEPQPLSYEEYCEFTPEKIELYSGYLFGNKDDKKLRLDMLFLLLKNIGLSDFVENLPDETAYEIKRLIETKRGG